MNETATILSAIVCRLKAHRRTFYWAVPACFIVVYLLMMLVPKRYASEFTLMRETEQAVETNRVITFNIPENYDLGLTKTDNAVRINGYEEIVRSPRFLRTLFDKNVATLDSAYAGTYAGYVETVYLKPKKEKELKAEYYCRREVNIIAAMRKQISCEVDPRTEVATVRVETRDPQVSAMVADYVESGLQQFIIDYKREKMQLVVDQLQVDILAADSAWQEAVRVHDPQAEVRKQIYESFCRQKVVYEAQMMAHPSYVTLSSPLICYRAVAPHRTLIALLATMLLTLSLGAWFCRKELAALL